MPSATEMGPQNNPETVRSPVALRSEGLVRPPWSRTSLRVIKLTIDIHPIHQAGRGDGCRAPKRFLCGVPRCSMVRLEMGVRVEHERSGGIHQCLVSSTWRRKWSPGRFGKAGVLFSYPCAKVRSREAQGGSGCWMFGQLECRKLGANGLCLVIHVCTWGWWNWEIV